MVNCEYDTREKTDVIQVDIVKTIIQNSGGSRISSRGGGANSPGGAPTYDFDKISQKMHEIERIWAPWGGARPSRPP